MNIDIVYISVLLYSVQTAMYYVQWTVCYP